MMFKNARITTLLYWGFGLVIVLIAGMTLFVFIKGDRLDESATLLVEDVNPKVAAAATIRLNIARNWANTLELAYLIEEGQRNRISDEMVANSKMISDNFGFLEKTMRSESGLALLGAALKARQAYTDDRKNYLELAKSGDKNEANRFFGSTLRIDMALYAEAVARIFEFQAEKMIVHGKATLAQTSLLKTTSVVVSLIVALVALFAAFQVSAAVKGVLGGDAHDAARIAREIAAGNLVVEIDASAKNTTSLLYSMKTMRDKLREMIDVLQTGARRVGEAAQQLAQTSRAVADASAQQSEATSATAAAMEQMTVGIESIAVSANSAKSFSQKSSDLSQTGGEVIRGAASEMEKISGSVESSSEIIAALEQQSNEISVIVSVIKEIADQTNLLALNAAIEAARAGEQGRGFAVVADEVRKLAERTSQSTHQIALTIDKIQAGTKAAVASMVAGVTQVRSGTALAVKAGESIGEIQSEAGNVVGVVSDIASALAEQGKASAEIARNVENIARTVEENNASSKEAATAARALQELADGLSAAVCSFRL